MVCKDLLADMTLFAWILTTVSHGRFLKTSAQSLAKRSKNSKNSSFGTRIDSEGYAHWGIDVDVVWGEAEWLMDTGCMLTLR